jgi:hypothetical protein
MLSSKSLIRLGEKPLFREDLSAEAKKYALLEAVTRRRLVKYSRLEKT